jgi:hypothetical protein
VEGSSGEEEEEVGEEESMDLGESALSKGERERILAAKREEKRREAREKMKQMRAVQHREQLQQFGPEAAAAAAAAEAGAKQAEQDVLAGKPESGLAAAGPANKGLAAAIAAATAAQAAGATSGGESVGPIGRANSGCLRRARASKSGEHGAAQGEDPASRSESTSRQRRNARRKATDGALEMPGESGKGCKCISPFQPVEENWNAVTFLNQTASRPRAPDAG